MKKTFLIILVVTLVFAACVPAALGAPEGFTMLMMDSEGTDVIRVQMRLRDLGYLSYRPTGRYFGMTAGAVQEFQKNNELDADGRCGELTYDKLFDIAVVRKPLSPEIVVTSGPALVGSPSQYGDLADWFDVVDAAWPVGDTATVTDFNSGITYEMKRTGGTNHAEVEPVDGDAYDEYIRSYGNKPNWEKRSVLVTIGSTTYAASGFGNQHGEDTVSDNVMDGHTCIYFQGSLSHVLGFADKEHFKMVLQAAGISASEWNQKWLENNN